MAKKEIKFTRRPGVAPAPADAAEAWIATPRDGGEAAKSAAVSVSDEPMKRLTIDLPENLHARVKSQCANRRVKMADAIRSLLEEHFPKDG